MFYCFQNEILLPGTQSFSMFGSGWVGYLKKSSGRVGYRDPVSPWSQPGHCLTPHGSPYTEAHRAEKQTVRLFVDDDEFLRVVIRLKRYSVAEDIRFIILDQGLNWFCS